MRFTQVSLISNIPQTSPSSVADAPPLAIPTLPAHNHGLAGRLGLMSWLWPRKLSN